MKRQDYEERQARIIREEWFRDHVANHQALNNLRPGEPAKPLLELSVIDWRKKEGGSVYAMRYIISRAHLIVIGDTGDAIFQWGEKIDFKFIAGCGLHYFHEKCQASEFGKDMVHWNIDVAEPAARERLKDLQVPDEKIEEAIEALHSGRCEFEQWLRDEWGTGKSPLGNADSESISNLLECGEVLHPRAIAMWVGIKMAYEQLKVTA